MLFDGFMEQETDDGRRQKRHDERRQQPSPLLVAAEKAPQHLPDSPPIQPQHRQKRARVQDDVEGIDRLVLHKTAEQGMPRIDRWRETHRVVRQDEVARG